jgi:outer membrane protein, multidrug efflux system
MSVERLGLLCCAALAACTTVGPNFKAPDVAAPVAFKTAFSAAALTPLKDTWWLLFADEQLNALEGEALAASPTLAAAQARAERARALLVGTRADELPRINADGSLGRFRSSREVATAPVVQGQRLAIEANQIQAQTSASWEVDLWGRVKRQTEVAQAQLDAASLDAAGARLALTADVANAWLLLRAIDDEARVLAAAQTSRGQALQVVQARFDAGATQELDLQRARTELANADADVAELARRRGLADNALAVLTGRNSSDFNTGVANSNLPAPPLVAAGLPSELLQRRPDLAQSLALLHAASAQIGVAEAAFYPSLRLTGAFGLASESLGSLLSAPARLFNLGPAVSLPLFDGGRNQANLAAAQAVHAEALANFRQRVLLALREVDDALFDLQQRRAIAAAQGRAAAAADRALRVAKLRYEQGASGYLEVTDADRSALAAQRALTQTRAAQWQGTLALVRAMGGGWGGPNTAVGE